MLETNKNGQCITYIAIVVTFFIWSFKKIVMIFKRGGVQYVDSQNVEKNADKLEMLNSKRRHA